MSVLNQSGSSLGNTYLFIIICFMLKLKSIFLVNNINCYYYEFDIKLVIVAIYICPVLRTNWEKQTFLFHAGSVWKNLEVNGN